MWFGSWSPQNAGGGKAKGSTLLFPQIPPASPAIPSSLFPPIPAPKSRADAAEGTAAPLVFTQIRKCQPHCRRADPEAGEQSVTDPGGGKAHLFRLFKFGTHRTYHSNALEAKGFVCFFFFFSTDIQENSMQLPCTHYTKETALINHWWNMEAFKISAAGTGMFSTPHTKGISGQTF